MDKACKVLDKGSFFMITRGTGEGGEDALLDGIRNLRHHLGLKEFLEKKLRSQFYGLLFFGRGSG